MAEGDDKNLDELAQELQNDKYPLPEGKEGKQITYQDVDVTIKFKKETKKKDAEMDERVLFSDTGFGLGELVYDESRGILRVPIVLAKEMVYHYDDYDAFRPRDELEAVASYLKGVPVTRGHPGAKIVTDRAEVGGWTVEAEYEDDELRAVLEIAEKSLIEDIRSGKLKGVSPGHFSRLDKAASGEYDGTHYDVTQREIFIDHIAIVEEGRCSVADGCGVVMDEYVKEEKDNKKKREEGDEEIKMVSKTVLGKLNSALKLADKLDDKALKEKLEELKKVLAEEESNSEKKQEGDEKEVAEEKEKTLDAARKKVEAERDKLKAELDTKVEAEKTVVIDELKTLQDIKTEDQLKAMSLDALKNDLELVKALQGGKFTVEDEGVAGTGAIQKAYRGVGRRGGKKE